MLPLAIPCSHDRLISPHNHVSVDNRGITTRCGAPTGLCCHTQGERFGGIPRGTCVWNSHCATFGNTNGGCVHLHGHRRLHCFPRSKVWPVILEGEVLPTGTNGMIFMAYDCVLTPLLSYALNTHDDSFLETRTNCDTDTGPDWQPCM